MLRIHLARIKAEEEEYKKQIKAIKLIRFHSIVSLVSGKHRLLLDKFQYICQRPILMMEIDCEREKEIETIEKLVNKRIKKV